MVPKLDAKGCRPPANEYAELLAATAAGDRGAFRALHHRVGPILLGVCMRLTRDRDLGHDALQEAMVRIWQKSHYFDPAKGTALGWMVTVTRNCAFNMIEKHGHLPLDDELVQTLEQGAEIGAGAAIDLSRCLDALSEKHRQCILLIYHFGLSYEELADRMGAPVNTAKTWVRRAIQELRLCLE